MSLPLSIKGKLELRGKPPHPPVRMEPRFIRRGRIPRVTKLLALAHRFQQLLRDGTVKDYAELARLGRVTRARITQIMNLLNLAPEIQEEILFLPPVLNGRDPITERQVRQIVAISNWQKQRRRNPISSSNSPDSLVDLSGLRL